MATVMVNVLRYSGRKLISLKDVLNFNFVKLCIWELRKKYAELRLGFPCLSHSKFDDIKIKIFFKINYF